MGPGSGPTAHSTQRWRSSPSSALSSATRCRKVCHCSPTRQGVPPAKSAILAALEATVEAYGGQVAQPSGARLLGGHSLRVTRAQRLAALGVDVVKIMVLARWAGESVLRYIRDAPLDNLPDEVKALEDKRNLLTQAHRTHHAGPLREIWAHSR